jgi:hypothetical protein
MAVRLSAVGTMSDTWWSQTAKIAEYSVELLTAKQEPRFTGVAARIALQLVWTGDPAGVGAAASLDFHDVPDDQVPEARISEGMLNVSYPFRRFDEVRRFLETEKPDFALGFTRKGVAADRLRVTLVGPTVSNAQPKAAPASAPAPARAPATRGKAKKS